MEEAVVEDPQTVEWIAQRVARINPLEHGVASVYANLPGGSLQHEDPMVPLSLVLAVIRGECWTRP